MPALDVERSFQALVVGAGEEGVDLTPREAELAHLLGEPPHRDAAGFAHLLVVGLDHAVGLDEPVQRREDKDLAARATGGGCGAREDVGELRARVEVARWGGARQLFVAAGNDEDGARRAGHAATLAPRPVYVTER